MAIDPCPCGLSAATTRYMGNIPNSNNSTISSVAAGDSVCGGDRDPRYVDESREIVHAGQAHDLPPRMVLFSLPGFKPLYFFGALL
jgi:hypothetical protein